MRRSKTAINAALSRHKRNNPRSPFGDKHAFFPTLTQPLCLGDFCISRIDLDYTFNASRPESIERFMVLRYAAPWSWRRVFWTSQSTSAIVHLLWNIRDWRKRSTASICVFASPLAFHLRSNSRIVRGPMQKRDYAAAVEHDTQSPLRQHRTTMQANSPNQSMKPL